MSITQCTVQSAFRREHYFPLKLLLMPLFKYVDRSVRISDRFRCFFVCGTLHIVSSSFSIFVLLNISSFVLKLD